MTKPTVPIGRKETHRLQKMVVYEEEAYLQGYRLIAGLDEAGRGPLAGPVVAAACIVPRGMLVAGVNDSKQLTEKAREKLFHQLTNDPSIQYGIGIISPEEIDRINIYQASLQAMWQAVDQLPIKPDYLLIDGKGGNHASIPSLKIVKGDQLSLSIAAASIIAKETRDRLMRQYHKQWPSYGFDQHKGYGTACHLEALERFGPCPLHRQTFEPIKSMARK